MRNKRTASTASLPRASSLGRVMSFGNLQYRPDSKKPNLRSGQRKKTHPSDPSMHTASSEEEDQGKYYSDIRFPKFFMEYIQNATKELINKIKHEDNEISSDQAKEQVENYKKSDDFLQSCQILKHVMDNPSTEGNISSEMHEQLYRLASWITFDTTYTKLPTQEKSLGMHCFAPQWIKSALYGKKSL